MKPHGKVIRGPKVGLSGLREGVGVDQHRVKVEPHLCWCAILPGAALVARGVHGCEVIPSFLVDQSLDRALVGALRAAEDELALAVAAADDDAVPTVAGQRDVGDKTCQNAAFDVSAKEEDARPNPSVDGK